MTGLRESWTVISGGVMDTGFAALANFAAAIYAVRTLDAELLGLYAFWLAAYRVAAVIPTQLVFVPAEVESLTRHGDERLGLLVQSIRLSVLPTLVTTLAIALVASFLDPVLGQSSIPLVATTVLASFVTPAQEHFRRSCHLAGHPYWAALVSATSFVTVLAVILAAELGNVPPIWVPIGSLAAAYATSAIVGWLKARHTVTSSLSQLSIRALLRSGRALLIAGLAPLVAGFAMASLMIRLAGPAVLGYAEAARVVSRPVFVVGLGFGTALRPRSMEAAQQRRRIGARSASRSLQMLVGLATISYLVAAGSDWPWNPMERLLPTAYVVPGLVALTVVAAGLDGLALPYRYELLGARRETAYARIEVIGNMVRTILAAASHWLRSYALPLGLLALAVARLVGYRLGLQSAYDHTSATTGITEPSADVHRGH
jgi:hypothetical protein